MVTSRNLKCMPSDDEDDFDEEDEDEDNEENQRNCKGDNSNVYDTTKHPFFSVDSENVTKHHPQANGKTKKSLNSGVEGRELKRGEREKRELRRKGRCKWKCICGKCKLT